MIASGFRLLGLAAVSLMVACGGGMDGTYTDQTEMLEYKFESNGSVLQSAMGIEIEFEYEMEGNKVRLLPPGTNGVAITMTLLDDGSLSTPMGKLRKKGESR